MKTYEVRNLLCEELDKNSSIMNAIEYAIRVRKLKNLKSFIKEDKTTAIVVIESKDICRLLQEQKWTIANTSSDTNNEIVGFKLKEELTKADFNMFDICFR